MLLGRAVLKFVFLFVLTLLMTYRKLDRTAVVEDATFLLVSSNRLRRMGIPLLYLVQQIISDQGIYNLLKLLCRVG